MANQQRRLCGLVVKEVLLEIGFIEEMRTIWSNKEVPQTFFHNSLYFRESDLTRLIPYHWQPCILQLCDITKDIISQKILAHQETRSPTGSSE